MIASNEYIRGIKATVQIITIMMKINAKNHIIFTTCVMSFIAYKCLILWSNRSAISHFMMWAQ